MIELYTDSTPNGFKISIALEELELEYKAHNVDFSVNEQKTPEFLALNPNGKIPVIIDRDNDDFIVIESGAILLYLAEKTGKLLPTNSKERSEVIQWLMWQMSSLGPMFGQLLVFAVPYENRLPEATQRYQKETLRLLQVLDKRLEEREFIIGNQHTITDIACFPWVRMTQRAQIPLSGCPNLNRWFQSLAARSAYQRGLAVPGDKPEEKRLQGFKAATVGIGS
ncbi:MAG: glutathione S-transferase N-terminal domain-containing protein [Pleurocapsa sp. MO_192.B19]|nr:glutathione S-transferase N-terminal domain-containing protein [Pleurocapsa sp. MO_192.B19]